MTSPDTGSVTPKEWAAIYADRTLLKADAEGQLRKKMARTRVPEGVEVVALPKPHRSMIL